MRLACTECQKEYSPERMIYSCEDCGAPLEIDYGSQLASSNLFKTEGDSIWRYKEALPVDPSSIVSLNEGWTPLWRADGLAKTLGIENLYLNETTNPTWSFKDRGSSVGSQRHWRWGQMELVVFPQETWLLHSRHTQQEQD